MRKKTTIALFACLILMASCQIRQREHQTRKPLKVTVCEMQTTENICRHTYVGEIEEQSSVALSMQTAGPVVRVAVAMGDKVRAGQVLMEVDSTNAVSAREAATAMLHQAKDGYERAMRVYHEGGISEQQRVEIETKLAQARSLYQTADKSVHDCRLVAPMAGVISQVHAKVGQNVAPGIMQMVLMNTENLRVRFAVPESEIASIRIGDEAWVTTPAVAHPGHRAVLTERGMVAARLAHTYDVLATLESASPELLPGMMARVQLKQDRIAGFVLPQSCVQILSDGAKVWIANGDKAERRTIRIGQYVTDGVLVTDGISVGDKVIIEGYQKLWQGAEITY